MEPKKTVERKKSFKCEMCGIIFEGYKPIGEFSIEFHADGIASLSASKKTVCDRCSLRLAPLFKEFVNYCSPICDDPWELVEKNNKLKNEIHDLKNQLMHKNR